MNPKQAFKSSTELMEYLCDTSVSLLGEEYSQYENDLKKSEEELEGILNLDLDHHAEEITFEQLCSITFIKAKKIIFKMSIKKRIAVLKDLDHRLVHLYDGLKGYNDQGFGKSLSPQIFYQMMGKIKHMEILQQWLYGID